MSEAIAETAAETGLGFLFARLTVEEMASGRLQPDTKELDAVLHSRAFGILLKSAAGREGEEAPPQALLQALALAPSPGLAIGDVWREIAEAIDGDVVADFEAQLRTLSHFGRFILEEHRGGETLYRWFHPALRKELRDQVGGLGSEAGHAAVRGLIELRDQQTNHWARPENASPFLLEILPAMIVEAGDFELITTSVKGAPEQAVRLQLVQLSRAAAEQRALGNFETSQSITTSAHLLTLGRGDALEASAMVAQAESLLVPFDDWRNARDLSNAALQLAHRLLAENWQQAEPLELLIGATRTLVRSLGRGGLDADEGVRVLGETLDKLALTDADALALVAQPLAKLLLSYSDSLSAVVNPRVAAASSTSSARICGLLVEAGREDLRVVHAESLVYAWIDRERCGDPGGVDDFRRAIDTILARPVSPEWMVRLGPLVGELAQRLGWDGEHEQAVDVLDRAVLAYEPAAEAAVAPAGYPLILGSALEQRSTVLALLGDAERAERDAERAVELAIAHHDSGLPTKGTRAPLALRLLDRGLPTDAAALLSSDHPLGEPASNPERTLHALARALARLEEGDAESAAGEARPPPPPLRPELDQPAAGIWLSVQHLRPRAARRPGPLVRPSGDEEGGGRRNSSARRLTTFPRPGDGRLTAAPAPPRKVDSRAGPALAAAGHEGVRRI